MRTLGTGHAVNGIVFSPEEFRKDSTPIEPAAKVKQGSLVWQETRLPLTSRISAKARLTQFQRGLDPDTDRAIKAKAKNILNDPLKVCSAYRNVFTKKIETADVSFIIEHHETKNGARCLITIQDSTTPNTAAMSLVIRNFEEPSPLVVAQEAVPLQRLKKLQEQPMSAWERLVSDDS